MWLLLFLYLSCVTECSSVTAVFSYCLYGFEALVNSITNPRLSINDNSCARVIEVPHKHNSLASMKPKILFLKCGFSFGAITFTIFHWVLDLV